MLSWEQIQANAVAFSKRWKGIASEKQQDQGFVEGLLRVFGVEDARAVGMFQEKTKIASSTKWIDYFWAKKIAVEMKSQGRNLEDAFEQLREYMYSVAEEDVPDLWLVSDFESMWLSRRSTNEQWRFKTKDLRKNVKRFADVAGYTMERTREDQLEINVKAAEKMARLHDELELHGYEGHDLQLYLVRLLFCMFAGDTGIFPHSNLYHYINDSKEDGSDLSHRISDFFEVLNMPDEVRSKKKLLSDELRQFRYINGNLFADRLPPADFNANTRKLLLECRAFDWSTISPAIFGAMFQGVIDKKQRRELGAHYTSEENIHKLINPLFMDELWAEFDRVRTSPAALDRFHEKIANLKFLDPACGCGNFLIVTYGKLRELELEILKMKFGSANQIIMDVSPMLKVTVEQFYGIEYEAFPCEIAKVGMWLADHQMNMKVAEEFGLYFARLPLKGGATIVHGNALRIDWESVVPKAQLSYILGNPPFVGARIMSPAQKADMLNIFDGVKNAGNLDYVAAWYRKAAVTITNTFIRVGFVSTNSISQGEQPSILWKQLLDQVAIDFAYRTFKWSNEGKGKAAVHCVIIGFSSIALARNPILYDNEERIEAQNINPYLLDAPNVLIESHSKPLCDVPEIGIGNKPIDGGNYLFTEEEKAEFLLTEPQAAEWFRPWLGSVEFINGWQRWCLWLGKCPPSVLRKMPNAMKRVEAVRQTRLASSSPPTQKLADTPTRFHVENMPDKKYIIFPKVSSERRRYIPIGLMQPTTLASDLVFIIQNATLYHFGILTSNVHNAWTRAVCGRLKSDYRYSKDIVYNNFPWPAPDEKQKAAIEAAAQSVLDARALFEGSSLADLYDPLTMPPELLKAHQRLDKAVWAAYGFTPRTHTSEAAVVAALMEMWRGLVG